MNNFFYSPVTRGLIVGGACGLMSIAYFNVGYEAGVSLPTALTATGIAAAVVGGLFGTMFSDADKQRKRKAEHERFLEEMRMRRMRPERHCRDWRNPKEDDFFKVKKVKPEEDKPVRKVCGALAEDFANAPEEVKREIFG